MVRDRIVDATTDPTLMRVQESTSEHYVPEVFYKFKNEYNTMVQEAANPTFPVEYFILSVRDALYDLVNS
jgi:nuclear protein localization family protein 4